MVVKLAQPRQVGGKEIVSVCRLCGTGGRLLYNNLNDRLYEVAGSYGFQRCSACEFIWLSPRPQREELAGCYPLSYEAHETPMPPVHRGTSNLRDLLRGLILSEAYGYPRFRQNVWWAAPVGKLLAKIPPLAAKARFGYDDLCPPFVPGGTCLDIGCGPGHYLAHMRDLGWDVVGLDLSSHAAEIARTIYQIHVEVGVLEEAKFHDGRFALVTMSHSLEHVPDPLATLKECYRILHPQGRLVLTTPNAAGLMSRLFREHWVSLDPPRHLSLFTPATLCRCVELAGFRIERERSRPRLARFDYEKSLRIARTGCAKDHVGSNAVSALAHLCDMVEQALLPVWPWAGNELMISAVKI
jgi:2-polyprenyl-3-methyl-5-hydroxy-6-metoxy-1,4-benzoquinol methylase